MKFRIIVSILTIAIIALFITVFVQTRRVVKLNDDLVIHKDSLKSVITHLTISETNLSKTRDSLVEVMKELDVYDAKAQELRREEVKKQNRSKYNLGITVQANNANYQSLVAYVVSSGFKRDYIIQKRQPVANAPVIYYYSQEAKTIAEDLKTDLIKKFPNLYMENFDVKPGQNGASNTITAKLMFR